jgi:pimeloyl-ACP methyl ester carboxylesterase
VRSSRLTIDDREYAYLEEGRGPLLLFGHGTYGGKELFEPQIEHLSSSYRCVAVDWPGHGGTTFAPQGWGVDELVDDVPRLLDALDADSAYLAGVSQGAAVFMRAVLRFPERARALVEMCAGPAGPPAAAIDVSRQFAAVLRDETDEAERRRAVERVVGEWFHVPGFAEVDPQAFAREVDVILSHPRAGIALAAEVPATYRSIADELGEIRCPTLVIWGDGDPRVEVAAEMARAIPGAELIVMPNAGHHVNVDAPHAVSVAIERFLQKVS